MTIDAQWAAVGVGAAVALGTFFGWLLRGRKEKRSELPAMRWDGRRIEIVNRLNEHLNVTRVEARGQLHFGEVAADAGGSIIPGTEVIYSSPTGLDWSVSPHGSASFRISIVNGPKKLALTISSSARTLRDRRIIVKALAKD